jgi:gamma-glutamyltranspeptidase/glutathione hydrolase
MLNVLDFHMPLRKAIEAPRIHHQWLPTEIIVEREIPEAVRRSLERRGHAVREGNSLGVVQAIVTERSKTMGEADPRKEDRGRSE